MYGKPISRYSPLQFVVQTVVCSELLQCICYSDHASELGAASTKFIYVHECTFIALLVVGKRLIKISKSM